MSYPCLGLSGFLLSSRNLKKLVRTYQFQSFLLVVIAICLGVRADNMVLLFVAALTLISKVLEFLHVQLYTEKNVYSARFEVLLS
jgi:hydrogenase-4 membrane subunit HyfE